VLPPAPDAPPAVVATELRVRVSPAQGSEVKFGDGDWMLVPPTGIVVRAIERPMTITARNPCCEMVGKEARAGQAELEIDMAFNPAWIVPACDRDDATVQIDDKLATLGRRTFVLFDGTLDSKTVKVVFVGKDKVDSRTVQVKSGQGTEVKCAF
jgi:hypothetical protein